MLAKKLIIFFSCVSFFFISEISAQTQPALITVSTTYPGLMLILLGLALMVAEGFILSFGVIGGVGIIAFLAGSIMLLHHHQVGLAWLLPVGIAVILVLAGYLVLVIQLALRARRRPIVSGAEEVIGSVGKVVIIQAHPFVRIRGELWQIEANYSLKEGDEVKVLGMDELILKVVPANKEPIQGES